MSDKTGIEWTDATWNPIVGCTLASPGCTHCYAMSMAARIERMNPASHYVGTTRSVNGKPVWTGKLAKAPAHTLMQPLRRKQPRRIFVNLMSDLFHEDVPDAWIDEVFAVMALCPQHTFQVLTKRSARMRQMLTAVRRPGLPERVCGVIARMVQSGQVTAEQGIAAHRRPATCLPNVWLGVSAEDQRRADERVPDLLATPAAVRFVSAEPLLGRIDFTRVRCPNACQPPDYCNRCSPDGRMSTGTFDALGNGSLDWIISGGENGPRPMHPDWVRDIRDQCAAAGVAFLFKQWGSFEVAVDRDRDDPDWRLDYANHYGEGNRTRWLNLDGGRGFHGERFHVMRNVGKHRAGRLLDGRIHDEMPLSCWNRARAEVAA